MRTTSILAALALLAATPAAAQQAADLGPYLIADRAAEATLARSAAPNAVSDSATALVLTREGFVEVAKGTNGFSCLVLRSFLGGVDDPGYWSPKVRAPHCFNPPAARTVLVETLERARWVMAGVSKTEIAARMTRGYASHAFPAPAAGAMAYMLSPHQYLSDADPHWMPHVMFYYDHSLPASAWGAGDMNAPIINASAGDPHGAVLTLFIPVRRWSDGTTAMTASSH
ncbi:MAG: hypothetical protein ABI601_10330 [bacterium]